MSEPQPKRPCLDRVVLCRKLCDISPDVIFDNILVHYVLKLGNFLDRVPSDNADFSETNRTHTLYPQFGKFKDARYQYIWTVFKSIQCNQKQLESCALGGVSTKHMSKMVEDMYWGRYYEMFHLRYVISLSKTKFWWVTMNSHRGRTPLDVSDLMTGQLDYPMFSMPEKLPQVVEISPLILDIPCLKDLPNLKSISGYCPDFTCLGLYNALACLRKIDIYFAMYSSLNKVEAPNMLRVFFSHEYPKLDTLKLDVGRVNDSFDVHMIRFPKLRSLELSGFKTTVTTGGAWDSMKRLHMAFNAPQLLPPALEYCFVVNGCMSGYERLPRSLRLWGSTLRFTQLVSNGGTLHLTSVSFPTICQTEWREHPITLSGIYRRVYWNHHEHLSYSLHVTANITNTLSVNKSCGELTLAMTGTLERFTYEMIEVGHEPTHSFNFRECNVLMFRGSAMNSNLDVGIGNCRSVRKMVLIKLQYLHFLNIDLANLTELTYLWLDSTDPSLVSSLFDMLHTRSKSLNTLLVRMPRGCFPEYLTKRELGRTKRLRVLGQGYHSVAPFAFNVLTEVELNDLTTLSWFRRIAKSLPVLKLMRFCNLVSETICGDLPLQSLKCISFKSCRRIHVESDMLQCAVALLNSSHISFEYTIKELYLTYSRRFDLMQVLNTVDCIQRSDYSDKALIKVNQCTVNPRGIYKLIKTMLEERGIKVTTGAYRSHTEVTSS